MKVVVITGASQGIGAETAKAFAEFEKNIILILISRSESKLSEVSNECKKMGADTHYFICDVTNDDQVANVANKILQQWGAPDVLVNNAGGFEPSNFSDTSGAHFRAQIDVNLTSAFLVTQAFFDDMLEKKSGDVFFLGSIASLYAHPGSVAYCAAKHGLLGLARSLRSVTKGNGIRVTTVMPGETLTPAWGATNVPQDEFIPARDIAKAIVDIHKLNRNTDVEEILVRPQKGGFVL